MLWPWAIIGISAAPHKRQTRESWQTTVKLTLRLADDGPLLGTLRPSSALAETGLSGVFPFNGSGVRLVAAAVLGGSLGGGRQDRQSQHKRRGVRWKLHRRACCI